MKIFYNESESSSKSSIYYLSDVWGIKPSPNTSQPWRDSRLIITSTIRCLLRFSIFDVDSQDGWLDGLHPRWQRLALSHKIRHKIEVKKNFMCLLMNMHVQHEERLINNTGHKDINDSFIMEWVLLLLMMKNVILQCPVRHMECRSERWSMKSCRASHSYLWVRRHCECKQTWVSRPGS